MMVAGVRFTAETHGQEAKSELDKMSAQVGVMIYRYRAR